MSAAGSNLNGVPVKLNFEVDQSLAFWNMSAKEWITKNGKDWDGLASGCIVFNKAGRVLLIQRASHDSMPNRWEVPGGAVDEEDQTLFYGAARELWEEAGLVAKRFAYIVAEGPGREPEQVFQNSTATRTWCRFAFVVEVEDSEHVKIDPAEHQDYVWATIDEVRSQRIGERELPITTEGMSNLVLEAFRLNENKGENL